MLEILLTGHKGFIGKHIHGHFESDYKIDTYNRGEELPNKDYDIVIHLAGSSGVRESWKRPLKYFKDNILLSWRIFKKYKRVIYTSTSAVSEPWRNPYAFSKYIVEKIAPKNSLGVRLATIYGPWSRKNMFISKLIDKKLKYVNIDCERDFIHIYDVISFFEIIMKNRIEGIVNVGTGKSIPLIDLINCKIPTRKSSFLEVKKEKVDVSKLKSLGFKPLFKVEDYINRAR